MLVRVCVALSILEHAVDVVIAFVEPIVVAAVVYFLSLVCFSLLCFSSVVVDALSEWWVLVGNGVEYEYEAECAAEYGDEFNGDIFKHGVVWIKRWVD